MTKTMVNWDAFESSNAIGDPGRQPDIRSTSGALNVGVPDSALDFLTADPFEIRACSSRGWSHRYKGTPRQDSYSLLVNDDVVVVAVADGVSEGEFSQVAAETAVRSACKLAADQMVRAGAVNWIQLARRISLRVIEEAEYRQISLADTSEPTIDDRLRACLAKMSTTLIVAIILRAPSPEGFTADIGVVAGDSAAYLLREGSLVPLGGGKDSSGPIASTGVRPLPGPVAPEVSRHSLLPGDALVIGTDGIGDPLDDGRGEVGREFANRWVTPPTIDQFLLDVNVYRRSYDDDRTAVGIWIRPEAALPEVLSDSAGPDPAISDSRSSEAQGSADAEDQDLPTAPGAAGPSAEPAMAPVDSEHSTVNDTATRATATGADTPAEPQSREV